MTKHSKKKKDDIKSEKQSRKKSQKILLFSSITIIFAVFIYLAFLAYDGFFDPIHTTKIDFSKKYLVTFLESELPRVLKSGETLTAHGGTGFITLIGFIELKSSSFSAQNPIQVRIEMYHAEYGEELDEDYWDSLPENFFAYFPKAKHTKLSDDPFEFEKPVVIQLNKSIVPQKISGEGKLIFPREDDFEFLIFDPFNVPAFDDLRTTLQFTYTVSSGTLIETDSSYDSTISIKSADSFDTVLSSRNYLMFSLAGFAIATPGIIFRIRNRLIK